MHVYIERVSIPTINAHVAKYTTSPVQKGSTVKGQSGPQFRTPQKPIPSRSHLSTYSRTGTVSSTSATFTIYHAPSSSLHHSASSSPESPSSSEPTSPSSSIRHPKHNARSSSIVRSGSASTLTSSIFIRENGPSSNTNAPNNSTPIATTAPSFPSHSPPLSPSSSPLLPPLERGPKLFFASAKTGEGVADVFEYIAHRVSRRWEYEEKMQARRMYYPESSAAETVHLGLDNGVNGGDLLVRHASGRGGWGHRCCS